MGRERPILFSGPMVRALLSGAKTQTRRVVKWPKWSDPNDPHQIAGLVEHRGIAWFEEGRPVKRYTCPYGVPGDRLWVRETWEQVNGITFYRADKTGESRGWKPSIHMPRWASRLTLEIVSVKVERVTEISHDDAIAEGIAEQPHGGGEGEPIMYSTGKFHSTDPVEAYALLWDLINAARGYGWEKNPWCWCLTVRVLR